MLVDFVRYELCRVSWSQLKSSRVSRRSEVWSPLFPPWVSQSTWEDVSLCRIFAAEVRNGFEIAFDTENNLSDSHRISVWLNGQVFHMRSPTTITMDDGLRTVIGDAQRQITSLPRGKTNIQRNITPSASFLDPTSSLSDCSTGDDNLESNISRCYRRH